MRKPLAVLIAAALIGVTGQAVAQTALKESKREMRFNTMDTNNDGMVTRDEFMKYHESMWNKIKRNEKDMAMRADVETMYGYGTVPSAIPGESRRKAKP